MFFSIIIPLYNRPQEIDELLYTLTLQTYTQFEVLVIEDGSVKDAREIVESYRDKLDVRYYFKHNEGQGFTRNYAFKLAKGDYFIMFDSDCLIPSDYLEIVHRHLLKHQLDAYGGPDAAHSSFTPVQKAISYAMTSPFTTGGIRGNKKRIGGAFHPRSFNMGISRRVWEATHGFILTRLGEDIEFSIRIQSMGFKTGLIPEAKVFHKRRTNFKQFYKQLHFFGRARINIYTFFPSQLKAVHFFPALFTLFVIFTALANALSIKLADVCNFLIAVYILLLFFHSWNANKSAKVAFLSIVAAFVQLIAYGLGFMQDFWKRIILKHS
ncbi:glycosyltransferase [Arcticibacter sp.]|jgi:glycosyltransferase involved in cell wall biosynthesis|uniref:glycosyltransferase n=1 Tax=Arcticibacter sp. TaxID=1872630 RepID=UPI00388E6F6B